MSPTDLIAALLIAVGLVGILVPLMPGSALVLATMLVWAVQVSEPVGWWAFAVAAALLAAGGVVKYAVPGRRLTGAGVPTRTLVVGGLAGVAGFFVVPVVGLFAGFVAGVYVAERVRLGGEAAWPSTVLALRAVGLSVLIELAAGVLAALVWLVGAVLT
ncbi:MAG: DUF456 domain-containing protein [Nocardioidaceae bacterium]